jgi:hypothetical protein
MQLHSDGSVKGPISSRATQGLMKETTLSRAQQRARAYAEMCQKRRRKAVDVAVLGTTVFEEAYERIYVEGQVHLKPDTPLTPEQRVVRDKVVSDNDALRSTCSYLTAAINMAKAVDYSYEVAPAAVKDARKVLQDTYDRVLPGCSLVDKTYDSYTVNNGDLDINVPAISMRLTTSKIAPIKPVKRFEPLLRTSISPDRPRATKETLIALGKRNLAAPMVEEPSHLISTMNRCYSKFFKKFCNPLYKLYLEYYRARPIMLTEENASLWTSNLDNEKLARLRSLNFTVSDQDVAKYNLMIKSQVKAKVDVSDAHEYSALQTVVYHDKEVNGYFSPIMMEVRARLEAILLPNVMLNIRKNNEKIENFLNVYELKNSTTHYVENDFSKYDKSQQWRALSLEWGLYELLGVSLEDLSLWRNGHMECTILDVSLGIKLISMLQRRSGDATTALGNTVVNMLSVADVYPIDDFVYAMFLGDDSIIALRQPIDVSRITDHMAFTYNLIAKAYQTVQGYFCSSYIVKTPYGVKFMRDPIKVIEKLGHMNTDSEEMLKEKHISLDDTLRHYGNEICLNALDIAVQVRRNLDFSIKGALRALDTVRSDYKEYRSMFSRMPVTIFG